MTAEGVMQLFEGHPFMDGLECVTFKKGYQLYTWEFNDYCPASKVQRTIDGLFDVLLKKMRQYYEWQWRDSITHKISEENQCKIEEMLQSIEERYRNF